ncbi:hypothetical protein SAMN02745166_01879 [Prosthecobacter debontii]|uniref:Uncharacterized protein n=1 Tax=Prosthecobacter debontii TaxID=48467 RepID=A0A1T4XRW8_9BACT|nr:hypothetical protein SAMN02745166_01879 [Prosthecobacter debontii]
MFHGARCLPEARLWTSSGSEAGFQNKRPGGYNRLSTAHARALKANRIEHNNTGYRFPKIWLGLHLFSCKMTLLYSPTRDGIQATTPPTP